MAKHNDGDFIHLWGDIESHYIKGHVDAEKAQAVLDFEFGDIKVESISHTFAFWGVGQDEMGDPSSIFYVRDKAGRGRFTVTEIEFSDISHEQKSN